MKCPNCKHDLRSIEYEGLQIETCDGCAGEWIDWGELGKIVRIREARFDAKGRRAIAESTTITGIVLENVDRDLTCPKCGGTTDPVNYGGDTGIIIDRCTSCRGLWVDGGELERIQMIVEGWEDALPDDLQEYGPVLRNIAAKQDKTDDVHVSRMPFVGGFINSAINGILDLTT